jgi:sporulation protein YlmC with PRC-barrel domain
MTNSSMLLRLHDTHLTVADPQQDVRGYKVMDKDGKDIGRVDDLLIDDTEKKVRFLLIGSGGFLGLGEKKFLIPVDAIAQIGADKVVIDRAGDDVAAGPNYDPQLMEEGELLKHYNDVYTYYGYLPFWGVGYHYPGFTYIL